MRAKQLQQSVRAAQLEHAMDRRGFLIASGSVLATAAFLAACGDDTGSAAAGGGNVTFGFSVPFAEVPAIATIKRLVKQHGEEVGWKVLLDETKAGNIQEQTSTLETWVTQKITACNVLPADPTALGTLARRAIDAGIIWTTYLERMEESAGGVLAPPDLQGEVAGKAAVDWIKRNNPTAEVLILEPSRGGSIKQRTAIPEKLIAEQTEAKIVAVQPAIEQVKGRQVTEDVLQAHPSVAVVVASTDDAGLGAAQAFKASGKQDPSNVYIIGQDGSEDGLTALKDPNSYFRATAALDAGKFAQECVDLPKRAIERNWQRGDKPEYVEFAPTLIKSGDTKLINKFLATYRS